MAKSELDTCLPLLDSRLFILFSFKCMKVSLIAATGFSRFMWPAFRQKMNGEKSSCVRLNLELYGWKELMVCTALDKLFGQFLAPSSELHILLSWLVKIWLDTSTLPWDCDLDGIWPKWIIPWFSHSCVKSGPKSDCPWSVYTVEQAGIIDKNFLNASQIDSFEIVFNGRAAK